MWNRGGLDDCRVSRCIGNDLIDQPFQMLDRFEMSTGNEAIVARNTVALRDLRQFLQQINDPLQLSR